MNADDLLSYAVDLTQAGEDDGDFVAQDDLGEVRFTVEQSRLWVTDERGPHAPETVAADSQRAVRAALRPRAPLSALSGEILTSLGRLTYAVEARYVPVHLPRPPLNAKVELNAAAPLKIGGHVHERLKLILFENGSAPRMMVPRLDWTSLGAGLGGELQGEAWTLSQLLSPLLFTDDLVDQAMREQARRAAAEAVTQWYAAWDVVTRCKAALAAHHAVGAVSVGALGVINSQQVQAAHAGGRLTEPYTRNHEL